MCVRVAHDVAIHIGHQVKLPVISVLVNGMFISMILAIVNGGIHLSAWNKHFPTTVERWLWRIACVTTGIFAFLLYIVARSSIFEDCTIRASWELRFNDQLTWFTILMRLLEERNNIARHADSKRLSLTSYSTPSRDSGESEQQLFMQDADGEWETTAIPKNPSLWGQLKFDFAFCLLIGYGVSILYITVESIISLRSVQAGSYKIPAWSQIWPHL
ncbi:hypothetical protein BDD12DRAFT_857784 [Trichophaea hybrida]|nr:hypothetical protein BDD12DRAFT_857784 [Trichophaea hybrida]